MLKHESQGAWAILEVAVARLDAANIAGFRQELENGFGGLTNVLLDLHQVDFMDSTGIGALVALQRQVKTMGGELMLCSPSKSVETIFRLMRFQRIMKVFPSREEAMAALGANPGA
jgi:anti-anti-sigma factor